MKKYVSKKRKMIIAHCRRNKMFYDPKFYYALKSDEFNIPFKCNSSNYNSVISTEIYRRKHFVLIRNSLSYLSIRFGSKIHTPSSQRKDLSL